MEDNAEVERWSRDFGERMPACGVVFGRDSGFNDWFTDVLWRSVFMLEAWTVIPSNDDPKGWIDEGKHTVVCKIQVCLFA